MDKALLEELYQRYGAEIFRYLYAMCRDRLLAEDVMQDAFCRALISLPTSHVNARAWLYMVGRNLLINEMKKRKRELCSDDMESRDVQSRKSGEGIADGDPEEQAIRKGRAEAGDPAPELLRAVYAQGGCCDHGNIL